MKRILIMLVILVAMVASGQAQDKLKIGEVRNGKLVVTNPDGLKAFFLKSLEYSGTLGKDLQISASPEGDRFFVAYPVDANKDKISSIGVLLIKIKNDVFIVGHFIDSVPGGIGPGISYEIDCIGEDCSNCNTKIIWIPGQLLPDVECVCVQGGGKCNMTTKTILHIN